MDADLVALINSGATTLLGLMIKDAWARSKKTASRLFSHNEDVASSVESELDETSRRLRIAFDSDDTDTQNEIATEWRSRLRRAVENDESLLDQLRDFVEQYKDCIDGRLESQTRISIKGKASGHGRIYQQGSGTQYNS
ncbi:hypothetical protein [Amycolatopsis plumensis]|uniref:Rx N-terminal domain-containing protein n=1 Tax=Amycolatopsis plumensis TaxID=236508 RepID=A0ABV5UAB5_9PSEU